MLHHKALLAAAQVTCSITLSGHDNEWIADDLLSLLMVCIHIVLLLE